MLSRTPLIAFASLPLISLSIAIHAPSVEHLNPDPPTVHQASVPVAPVASIGCVGKLEEKNPKLYRCKQAGTVVCLEPKSAPCRYWVSRGPELPTKPTDLVEHWLRPEVTIEMDRDLWYTASLTGSLEK